MGNHLVAHLIFDLFIACTEVNTYLDTKYFLKRVAIFWIEKNQDKVLINSSYINYNTYGIPSKFRKRKISHISETAPTHGSDYDEKEGFWQKILNTKKQYICSCQKNLIYFSCILGMSLYKWNHPMHVLEKCTGNSVTRWNWFSLFPIFCQHIFIKLLILMYFNSSFQYMYQ